MSTHRVRTSPSTTEPAVLSGSPPVLPSLVTPSFLVGRRRLRSLGSQPREGSISSFYVKGRNGCKCLSLLVRYPLASEVVRIVAISATVDGQVTPNIFTVRKINLGDRPYSLVIDSADQPHNTPSPANSLLLLFCHGPLEPAAGAPSLARRDHSRTAVSAAKSNRRAQDSSPISINSSASITASSRDWILAPSTSSRVD